MLTSWHLHEKSREVYQNKVTSSLACIHGQVTKFTTVKWTIDDKIGEINKNCHYHDANSASRISQKAPLKTSNFP